MPKLSKAAGGSVQIGDIIQSRTTKLADGKRLLPCDGRVLDEVEYPLLAAVIDEVPVLTRQWVDAYPSFKMAGTPDGSKYLTNVVGISSSQSQVITAESDGTAINAKSIGQGGLNPAISDDGQYIYSIDIDRSASNIVYILRSADGGLTSESVSLGFTTKTTNVTNPKFKEPLSIECDPTGQYVLAYATQGGDDQIARCLYSSDYGVSFTSIAPFNGLLISTSDQVPQYHCILTNKALDFQMLYPLCLLSIDGAAPIDINGHPTFDGASSLGRTYAIAANARRILSVMNMSATYTDLLYAYSDDGVTWEKRKLNILEVLKERGYAANISTGYTLNLLSGDGNYLISVFTDENSNQVVVFTDVLTNTVASITQLPTKMGYTAIGGTWNGSNRCSAIYDPASKTHRIFISAGEDQNEPIKGHILVFIEQKRITLPTGGTDNTSSMVADNE